jgi:hypothetical protein
VGAIEADHVDVAASPLVSVTVLDDEVVDEAAAVLLLLHIPK